VIEVLVKAGDTIKAEQSLITVESNKASMEIPASQGGVVRELKVKLGDKVKQGSVVLLLEPSSAQRTDLPSTDAGQAAPSRAGMGANPAVLPLPVGEGRGEGLPAPAPAPLAASFSGSADLDCDLLVLGAGPGGYSAAFRAADLGLKVVPLALAQGAVKRAARPSRLPAAASIPVQSGRCGVSPVEKIDTHRRHRFQADINSMIASALIRALLAGPRFPLS